MLPSTFSLHTMAKLPVLTDDARAALLRMRTDNKTTRHELHEAMRVALVNAKFNLAAAAKQAIGSGYRHSAGDPREAWRAVRANVWKEGKGLGGSLTILDDRSTAETRPWPLTTRKPRPRSSRTQQVMDYHGRSRAFVLRWLNAGTQRRVTGGRNARQGKTIHVRVNGGKITWRGRIRGSGWFEQSGVAAINQSLEQLGNTMPETLINQFDS